MSLIETNELLELSVIPLFIAISYLIVKELKSHRERFTKQSYIYFVLLTIYLVIVWNITPTTLNWINLD